MVGCGPTDSAGKRNTSVPISFAFHVTWTIPGPGSAEAFGANSDEIAIPIAMIDSAIPSLRRIPKEHIDGFIENNPGGMIEGKG